MADENCAHPQVKKNLLSIRVVMGLVLGTFVMFRFLSPNPDVPLLVGALAAILLSFAPFVWMKEEQWCKMFNQYLVFFMDIALILGTLYVTDHLETEFLLSFFLTLFISALSRSVTNSMVVALAVTGLYLYRVNLLRPDTDLLSPTLLLSCSLLFMVAIEAGYLAYRVVEEEEELVSMARKMNALHQQVKEGNQASLEYAGSLKNVLDSLPLGALAVSRQGEILFINQTVGRLLDLNPRALTNMSIHNAKLGPLGERMVQSLKDKVYLKREYMDITWGGRARRFRLDSSEGVVPGAGVWGTLFLLQEAAKPAASETTPTSEPPSQA